MGRAIPAARLAMIRRLYEGGALRGDLMRVEEIAALSAVSPRTVRARAAALGWTRRGGEAGEGRLAGPDAADAADAADVAGGPVDRRVLIARLWAALDRHMAEEEARPADDARRPQDLDVLVRTIERLSGLERGPAPDAAPPDTEALRAELLKRIEALAGER